MTLYKRISDIFLQLFTINLIYDKINIFKICKMILLPYKEKKKLFYYFL